MRSTKKRMIALAALAFAIAVSSIWFASCQNPEPTFAGEPLTIWISRYFDQDDSREKESAAAAIRAMGDTASAQLAHWMRYESTPTKEKLEQFLRRGPVSFRRRIPFSPSVAEERADRAARVFPLLGPAATNAIPQLLTLLTDGHAIQSARRAMMVLSEIGEPALGPLLSLLADTRTSNRDIVVVTIANMKLDHRAAAQALPLLLKNAADPDTSVADGALFALGELDVDPDAAVPVLLSKAADPSRELRYRATSSLAKFASTPHHDAIARALTILLSDPDQDTREAATNLMAEITSAVITNTAHR